jgi:hypothetical protein
LRSAARYGGASGFSSGGTLDDPIAAQDDPIAAQDRPAAAQDEPAAAQDAPLAAQDDPAAIQDRPAAVQDMYPFRDAPCARRSSGGPAHSLTG